MDVIPKQSEAFKGSGQASEVSNLYDVADLFFLVFDICDMKTRARIDMTCTDFMTRKWWQRITYIDTSSSRGLQPAEAFASLPFDALCSLNTDLLEDRPISELELQLFTKLSCLTITTNSGKLTPGFTKLFTSVDRAKLTHLHFNIKPAFIPTWLDCCAKYTLPSLEHITLPISADTLRRLPSMVPNLKSATFMSEEKKFSNLANLLKTFAETLSATLEKVDVRPINQPRWARDLSLFDELLGDKMCTTYNPAATAEKCMNLYGLSISKLFLNGEPYWTHVLTHAHNRGNEIDWDVFKQMIELCGDVLPSVPLTRRLLSYCGRNHCYSPEFWSSWLTSYLYTVPRDRQAIDMVEGVIMCLLNLHRFSDELIEEIKVRIEEYPPFIATVCRNQKMFTKVWTWIKHCQFDLSPVLSSPNCIEFMAQKNHFSLNRILNHIDFKKLDKKDFIFEEILKATFSDGQETVQLLMIFFKHYGSNKAFFPTFKRLVMAHPKKSLFQTLQLATHAADIAIKAEDPELTSFVVKTYMNLNGATERRYDVFRHIVDNHKPRSVKYLDALITLCWQSALMKCPNTHALTTHMRALLKIIDQAPDPIYAFAQAREPQDLPEGFESNKKVGVADVHEAVQMSLELKKRKALPERANRGTRSSD